MMNEHVRATRHTVGMVEERERRIGKDCDRQAASPGEVWRDRRDIYPSDIWSTGCPLASLITRVSPMGG
jgi:hypothetical protein